MDFSIAMGLDKIAMLLPGPDSLGLNLIFQRDCAYRPMLSPPFIIVWIDFC
jgi:hypothetical protein